MTTGRAMEGLYSKNVKGGTIVLPKLWDRKETVMLILAKCPSKGERNDNDRVIVILVFFHFDSHSVIF